ncbi:interleukin-23 receptor [Protopterus annectens]|uniref:interleukin-23 receptor n=1 Tax=Protopterus annectens TaxID=7888 RepID=UPI001CFB0591|nr:interleukin-23 receptor [Protopterus annectens]
MNHRSPKVTLVMLILFFCICEGCNVLHCNGHVWVEPAQFFHMGTDISINCKSSIENCRRKKFSMVLDGTAVTENLHIVNESTVQLRLHRFMKPCSTVVCFVTCGNEEKDHLVNGKDFSPGWTNRGIQKHFACHGKQFCMNNNRMQVVSYSERHSKCKGVSLARFA